MCNWFLIMTIVSRTRIFDKPPLPQWETPKSATFYVEKKDGCIRPIAKIFPLSGGRSRSMSTVVRSLSTPNVPFVADFGSYLLTLVGKNVAIMVKFRAKNQMMNNAAMLLKQNSCCRLTAARTGSRMFTFISHENSVKKQSLLKVGTTVY